MLPTSKAVDTELPLASSTARPSQAFTNPLAPEWSCLGNLIGWKATLDKANTQNTTFGLLSVLLVTLSFPAFVATPDFSVVADEDGLVPLGLRYDVLAIAYGTLMFLSTAFSLVDILLCTVCVMQMSLCCDDRSITEFFERFGWLMGANFAFFALSVAALIGAAFTVLAGRYSAAMVITLSVVCLVFMVMVLSVVVTVYFKFTLVHLERTFNERMGKSGAPLLQAAAGKGIGGSVGSGRVYPE